MIFETSWDDGSKFDWKLIELLKKYDTPAIFYLPINCEIGMFEARKIAEIYEVGCHTFSHPQDMKLLDEDNLRLEVATAKEVLEIAIAKPVTKFCYPRGRYSPFVRDYVKKAGFKEARTTVVGKTDMDFDLFEKPTSIHAYQRKEYGDMDWLDFAKGVYQLSKRNGYFHLWGHSAEIEKNNDWDKLEELLKYIHENRNS